MITLVVAGLSHDVVAAFRALPSRIEAFFQNIATARLMAQRFQWLSSLSDAELARRGLKRQDIARTVLKLAHRS